VIGAATGSRRRPGGAAAASSLALSAVLAGAAVLALGRPDLALAGDFLSSGRPSREGALAAVQVVVWGLVALLVLALAAEALRRSVNAAGEIRRRRVHAQLALLAGLLVLVGGAIHHQSQVGALCCGDIARADRLVR
jgi:FAD/FMN-containing dehydrogenase